MKEYHQYLDNQCQENINEDIEMSPNSERNPIRNGISPPENIRLNINLTVKNPEVQNISLNNQSEEKKKDNPNGNKDINKDTQMNKDQESNDLENNYLLDMEYNSDDKLNFYPDISKIEVNRTLNCYQYTEIPGTELAETINHTQTIHIMRVDEDTHDETMRHN